jgi:hypothetical protein
MGFLPVVPMTIVSGVLMVVVSLATRHAAKPSAATLARYFDVAQLKSRPTTATS